jgi:hypothetical protein
MREFQGNVHGLVYPLKCRMFNIIQDYDT